MSFTPEIVLKALSNVMDPDLQKDLVTLKMIRDINIDGYKLSFTLELTTPACPLKAEIERACTNAIHQLIDKNIEVKINTTANVTSKRTTNQKVLPEVKNIIAVASGKGGVGKSTVAVNLALAFSLKGAAVGLIDADIYGPSIPIMLDLKNAKPKATNIYGKNYMLPIEKYGIKVLSIGFFADASQALPWRGPMVSSALRQFVTEADWGKLDYLVIDLPPGTGDIHLTLVSSVPVTGAVVISTPQEVALADARKALNMFANPNINVSVLGLIENMAYFESDDLPGKKYYIFGKEGTVRLSTELNVPLLGQIPIMENICESGDKGLPAVLGQNKRIADIYSSIAERVAQQIAIKNSTAVTKEILLPS